MTIGLHFKWGRSGQERAECLDRASDLAFRRSSGVPHDRLYVSFEDGRFVLSFSGCNKAAEFERRQDAERFIQAHYRKVRDRLSEGCHY